jgi:hypothetical protein
MIKITKQEEGRLELTYNLPDGSECKVVIDEHYENGVVIGKEMGFSVWVDPFYMNPDEGPDRESTPRVQLYPSAHENDGREAAPVGFKLAGSTVTAYCDDAKRFVNRI